MVRAYSAEEVRSIVTKAAPVKLYLDWERKRLKVDGVELGRYLNDTSWEFLASLADIRPQRPGSALDGEGVMPMNHQVGGRVSAATCRRELGRQLPQGIARLFVQFVRGKGYRLAHDVKVPGRSEAGVVFQDHGSLQGLDPAVREMKKRYG